MNYLTFKVRVNRSGGIYIDVTTDFNDTNYELYQRSNNGNPGLVSEIEGEYIENKK